MSTSSMDRLYSRILNSTDRPAATEVDQ